MLCEWLSVNCYYCLSDCFRAVLNCVSIQLIASVFDSGVIVDYWFVCSSQYIGCVCQLTISRLNWITLWFQLIASVVDYSRCDIQLIISGCDLIVSELLLHCIMYSIDCHCVLVNCFLLFFSFVCYFNWLFWSWNRFIFCCALQSHTFDCFNKELSFYTLILFIFCENFWNFNSPPLELSLNLFSISTVEHLNIYSKNNWLHFDKVKQC